MAVLAIAISRHTYPLPHALVLGVFLVGLGRIRGYRDHTAPRTHVREHSLDLFPSHRTRPFDAPSPVRVK